MKIEKIKKKHLLQTSHIFLPGKNHEKFQLKTILKFIMLNLLSMFLEIVIALVVILISAYIIRKKMKKIWIKRSLFTPNEKLLIDLCKDNEFDKFVDHFE